MRAEQDTCHGPQMVALGAIRWAADESTPYESDAARVAAIRAALAALDIVKGGGDLG
jgi:hypothetical protein